jgi:hypothetical protein
MQARDLAQADEQVGDDENDECGDHGCRFIGIKFFFRKFSRRGAELAEKSLINVLGKYQD